MSPRCCLLFCATSCRPVSWFARAWVRPLAWHVTRTIVIAPDSFKGTIGAADAAPAIAAGWLRSAMTTNQPAAHGRRR